MPDVLIRGLDQGTHEALKQRAAAEGVSLQAYVSRLLTQHAARPSIDEWLERLDRLPPVRVSISGADAVAAARAELP